MLTKGGTPFNVSVARGDSISIAFEVIDADDGPYDWTGATILSGIGTGGLGWHVATPAAGVLTLFLTGPETTALGASTFVQWVRVTKGSTTSTWLAGELRVREIGEPGIPSALTRTIYIVESPTGTLRLTGCVGDATGATGGGGSGGNIDGGTAASVYGGTDPIDGGDA